MVQYQSVQVLYCTKLRYAHFDTIFVVQFFTPTLKYIKKFIINIIIGYNLHMHASRVLRRIGSVQYNSQTQHRISEQGLSMNIFNI